ncbi:MAG: enoyl-CoA hydratase [Gammaproteobacteria bacterium]|nr:enoyl-CoA hydratase [Gammaproteobacteria bacterium]MCY4274970.1 enoyl-CoA hydratase [Gammaproteobacteria bacterium]
MTNRSPVLLCEIHDGICTLTLNRPKSFNALSEELLVRLSDTLDEIADNPKIRVVIIAGAGPAFCAGHDLKEMQQDSNRIQHQKKFSKSGETMIKITNLPQPVIARVHGMATAAGCQLVATCDLAVAAKNAKFAVSGVKLGLFCSTPAVALTRNISRKRAMEMLLTGDFIEAETALNFGLINQVVEPDKLDQSVDTLARKITAHPPRVVNLGKSSFYKQIEQQTHDAYEQTSQVISDNMMLKETVEGINAFLEKREPYWRSKEG